MHECTYLFIYLFIYLVVYLFIYLVVYLYILFIHSGQEASTYPPTTRRPEAIRLNPNSEEKLAQVEEIVQKYDLFTYLSITVILSEDSL